MCALNFMLNRQSIEEIGVVYVYSEADNMTIGNFKYFIRMAIVHYADYYIVRNGVSTAVAPVNGALTGRPMRVTFLTPRPVTEDRSKPTAVQQQQLAKRTLNIAITCNNH